MTVSATEPSAPAAAPSAPAAAPGTVTLATADFVQLLAAAGHRAAADVEADASPSAIAAAMKAIPAELKKINWPFVIVTLVAFSALALHFPKVLPFGF